MRYDRIKKIKFQLKCHLNFMLHKLFRILTPLQRDRLVTIIPHEGLGDLISILPALQALHDEGIYITLATDVTKWSQLKNAFMDVPEVDIIKIVPDSNYSIHPDILNNHISAIVPLGYYSKFGFVVDYPYSFFWQLGIDRKVMANFLCLKPCDHDFHLPETYDFIDLGTSKGMMTIHDISNSENKVTFLSNTEMIVNQSGSERYLALNPTISFHHKIYIALMSQLIICSDAALFNAVIRMATHPKIIVHTRKHYHSHCREIYVDCVFDGGIYEFPARRA